MKSFEVFREKLQNMNAVLEIAQHGTTQNKIEGAHSLKTVQQMLLLHKKESLQYLQIRHSEYKKLNIFGNIHVLFFQ